MKGSGVPFATLGVPAATRVAPCVGLVSAEAQRQCSRQPFRQDSALGREHRDFSLKRASARACCWISPATNCPRAGSEPGQGWGPGSTVSPPRRPGLRSASGVGDNADVICAGWRRCPLPTVPTEALPHASASRSAPGLGDGEPGRDGLPESAVADAASAGAVRGHTPGHHRRHGQPRLDHLVHGHGESGRTGRHRCAIRQGRYMNVDRRRTPVQGSAHPPPRAPTG
jgi:hypothetical protein